jgi:non-heme chloroperoxidase
MDTYAHDLATLVEALELRNAIHVGHFTGGVEVASYLGRAGHPARSPSRADQCRATTDAEDGGQCRRHANRRIRKLRSAVQADRSQISEGMRESFWLQGMMAGFPASYFCVKAFSETDQTEDLKKFDVPTLILHGDDDQIADRRLSHAFFEIDRRRGPQDLQRRAAVRFVTLGITPGQPQAIKGDYES